MYVSILTYTFSFLGETTNSRFQHTCVLWICETGTKISNTVYVENDIRQEFFEFITIIFDNRGDIWMAYKETRYKMGNAFFNIICDAYDTQRTTYNGSWLMVVRSVETYDNTQKWDENTTMEKWKTLRDRSENEDIQQISNIQDICRYTRGKTTLIKWHVRLVKQVKTKNKINHTKEK